MALFWQTALLMLCLGAVFGLAAAVLGLALGEWAVPILCFLLAAGVVTTLIRAYQELMSRLDRIEEKLDRLTGNRPEPPRKDALTKQ